jgi:hypothetical protein
LFLLSVPPHRDRDGRAGGTKGALLAHPYLARVPGVDTRPRVFCAILARSFMKMCALCTTHVESGKPHDDVIRILLKLFKIRAAQTRGRRRACTPRGGMRRPKIYFSLPPPCGLWLCDSHTLQCEIITRAVARLRDRHCAVEFSRVRRELYFVWRCFFPSAGSGYFVRAHGAGTRTSLDCTHSRLIDRAFPL